MNERSYYENIDFPNKLTSEGVKITFSTTRYEYSDGNDRGTSMLTRIEAQHCANTIILRMTGASMQNVVSLREISFQTPPWVENKKTVSAS